MNRDGLALEGHDVERLRIVDQSEAALRRNRFDDVADMLSVWVVEKMKAGAPMPSAAICGASGLEWSTT